VIVDLTAYESLLPPVTGANRPYWDGCAVGELRLQRCLDCQEFRFPESPICASCLSSRSIWQAVSGRAKLWSWIRMHQNYFPAFRDELPYLVIFVQLEEGPYMISTLLGAQDALRPGLPLEVAFDRVTPDRFIPKFREPA
jgi:uncharacterized OB-fold protein